MQFCRCQKENTDTCHPWSGECQCKPGWSGETCNQPCPLFKYGKNCEHRCNCTNNASCDPVNGTCICQPGFRGTKCSEPCPENTYGDQCAYKCNCKNGATCARDTGMCDCPAGKSNCTALKKKKNFLGNLSSECQLFSFSFNPLHFSTRKARSLFKFLLNTRLGEALTICTGKLTAHFHLIVRLKITVRNVLCLCTFASCHTFSLLVLILGARSLRTEMKMLR